MGTDPTAANLDHWAEAISEFTGIDAADYAWSLTGTGGADTNIVFRAVTPGAVDPNETKILTAGGAAGTKGLAYLSVGGANAFNKINFVVGTNASDQSLINKHKRRV